MLTRLRVKNFKKLDEIDIELDKSVVLIGPNNSGKTAALQALTLWESGLRQWISKRGGKARPEKRPGVTINRRDLISIPIPSADLLWRGLHVRNMIRETGTGKTAQTQNIRIEVVVDGIANGQKWSCGLEFDYTNEESFACRPLREPGYEEEKIENVKFSTLPDAATGVKLAYLPPMSGLAAVEPKWEKGRINVLIGEGQTAQILRNLCYQIYGGDEDEEKKERSSHEAWQELATQIRDLFGVELQPPKHIRERGEITMEYQEHGVRLDLSCSGRGLQQTLLLLAHLYANPKTVLLLDEPDAHLEILRQRQIYQLISDVAERQGSQIIAASHSEVVLSEAATRGLVVAFVGKPHKINDRGSQVLKALTDIGWDQYYQAELTGWILYLEGATDLAILRTFAKTLGHQAADYLSLPFVHYVATNLPQKARDHFYGLREAKANFEGIALFDRLDKNLEAGTPLTEMMWQRREIENYFCTEQVLLAYARHDLPDDLFGQAEKEKREQIMRESIQEIAGALQKLGKPDPWSPDIKATDEFLDPLFKEFFAKLQLPLVMRKVDYHLLAAFLPKDMIDSEIKQKLDAIVTIASRASTPVD